MLQLESSRKTKIKLSLQCFQLFHWNLPCQKSTEAKIIHTFLLDEFHAVMPSRCGNILIAHGTDVVSIFCKSSFLCYADARKRCGSLSISEEEQQGSAKRQAMSPEVRVKEEMEQGLSAHREAHIPSPEDDTKSSYQQSSVGSHNFALEDLPQNCRYISLPRFARPEIRSLSSRFPPIELLSRIFPNHSQSTLELILQSCHGSTVEAIECLLATQRTRVTNSMTSGEVGLRYPSAAHASSFLHSPVEHGVIRPLPSAQAYPSQRIYPPSHMPPPPLLVKPKPEPARFSFTTMSRASHVDTRPSLVTENRKCELAPSKFCTNCGHRIHAFDKFCSCCGKVLTNPGPL